MSTNSSIRVNFRWMAPTRPNGLIEGYRLRICNGFDPDVEEEDCESISLGTRDREYTMDHLLSFSQYNLKVNCNIFNVSLILNITYLDLGKNRCWRGREQ
jgi:hypothetical protein